MTFASCDALSTRQVALLDAWLPDAAIVASHGWGLVATTVLEVVRGTDRLIVKAGGERDGHIAREITAHRNWLSPWTTRGRAPVLVACDGDAKLVVTRYLPGRLVLGDRPEHRGLHLVAGQGGSGIETSPAAAALAASIIRA